MRRFCNALVHFIREADILLLILSLGSAIYGIVLISSVLKNNSGGSVAVQIGAVVIGVVLFVMFSYIDIDIIADKSRILLIISVLLIGMLLFWGVGEESTGHRAWLRFLGIGIQPTEIIKIVFIIVTARMMANYRDRKTLNTFVSILQIFLVFVLIFGLVSLVAGDLGSALVFLFIFVVMLFVGGIKLRWFLIGGALFAAVSPLLWFNFMSETQKNRIRVLFIPEVIDPSRNDVLWQTDQSIRAMSSSGFVGQGLGKGSMTQGGRIPVQSSDFIFSAAGEELGFIGCMLIILLLVAIIIRCIYVGVRSNNTLGMLVCTGISAMLIAQAFENIGMCLGLLPVIGITLPFFSYGGSSIVTCFAAMGIVSGIKMRPKPLSFRYL